MSKIYSSLRDDLIRTTGDQEYRHGYAEESLNLTIATQIKVLREQRDLTQEVLANEAEMKQSMISRYENANYSSWSINTLKKLAKAFDVFLDIRFRSFQSLVELTEDFNRETLQVPKFTEDPYFQEVESTIGTQRVSNLASAILAQSLDLPSLAQAPAYVTQVGSAISATGAVLHVLTTIRRTNEPVWIEPDETP